MENSPNSPSVHRMTKILKKPFDPIEYRNSQIKSNPEYKTQRINDLDKEKIRNFSGLSQTKIRENSANSI